MHIAYLADEDDFDGWRDAARRFALADISPADIVWQVGDIPGDLFAADADAPMLYLAGMAVLGVALGLHVMMRRPHLAG